MEPPSLQSAATAATLHPPTHPPTHPPFPLQSLVHFDLKSANLLLGYRDRRPICKVADFGLSKQASSWRRWWLLALPQ